MSLRRVFIYLLRPRWHRKSFRTATRYPAPTTPEQPDFAHGKFLVFCNLQPTKSACSAATENGLSGVGQPLSSVSGRKRYNTLDFASKIVCQQGCSRPYWKPRAEGIFSSGRPSFSSPVYIQTCDRLYILHSPKTQKSHRLHSLIGMKTVEFFVVAVRRPFLF